MHFDQKLVLHQWLLGLFKVERFEELAEHLRDETLEGLDENNIHRYHNALTAHFPDLPELPEQMLLEYDLNIVRHTQRLNENRITRGESPIVWKYFQYLALLFTEIYLDRYFRDPQALLKAVNTRIAVFNAAVEAAERIKLLDESEEAWSQLNKLVFWCATGSGKTLLMHANILQYKQYLEKYGRKRDLNRILLLTPNEGLSQQHWRDFIVAGIDAEKFNKYGRGLYAGQAVEILDIHKLREESGEKTVAVDAFENNNLVLIDEGHRGASAGEKGAWMRFRNALCEKGFSFEYSATFAQAVKGNAVLTDMYAKGIIFNYSYRYFYNDGFGKDYQIINLDEDTQTQHHKLYMTACLLAFFQQQRLYQKHEAAFLPFHFDRPLWIFVGSSVTKTLAKRDASDIVVILNFLSHYVADRSGSIQRIDHVLNQGLVTAKGKNLFDGRFTYLNTTGLTPTQVFDETLATIFNAPGGGRLYVENLKGVTGEIALRIGADNEPFGVINVGDDAKLVKLCNEQGLDTGEREFSGSLFHEIEESHSTVNVLIGSKKFTEGWNCWRVSTMGLMNVGATEGAQIIQLFGRGVRLKGFEKSLKRSDKVQLPDGIERPNNINVLETLSIFGIRANYMTQFREFLEEEGLPTERIEFLLPVIKNLGTRRLKTIRLKKTINGVSTEFGDAFRKLGPIPTLALPTDYLQKNQVVLNWYPKIQAIKSSGVKGGGGVAAPNEAHFTGRHIAFLDVDELYFELERFKAERGWHNLNLSREVIAQLIKDQSWYTLLIPEDELAFDSFQKVYLWQEISLALIRKYVERYYTFRKREWEMPHLEYQDLSANDPNMLGKGESPDDPYYSILIEESQQEIVEKLRKLKEEIEAKRLHRLNFKGLITLWFDRHLYQPLLYLDSKIVEISPAPLNKGERQFIEDLKTFYEIEKAKGDASFFYEKELYLLRNLSKGRGVGFFEADNFHPDFILWLLAGDKQHIAFVDPKGIRNLGPTDPKILFYNRIKEIETRLGDRNVVLDAFTVSNTASHEMHRKWNMDKTTMQAQHILFQEEDKDTYISEMFAVIGV